MLLCFYFIPWFCSWNRHLLSILKANHRSEFGEISNISLMSWLDGLFPFSKFDPAVGDCYCWAAAEQKSFAHQPHVDCLFWPRCHCMSIPNDPAAACRTCMCGLRSRWLVWLAQPFFHEPSIFLSSPLWEFCPSQKVINVHECLPHCVSWHVLPSPHGMRTHAWGTLVGECVCVHVGGLE